LDLSTVYHVAEHIQCAASNPSGTGLSFTCSLNPNASCTVPFYLIVANYYSPRHPDGDPRLLNPNQLTAAPADGNSIPYILTSLSGPGAEYGQLAAHNAVVTVKPL
jgi:hypothetical protein